MRMNGLYRLLAIFFLILPPRLNLIPQSGQQEVAPSEEISHTEGSRFLITPYYGKEVLRSYFDHELPLGEDTEDGYILRYMDEEHLSGADKSVCTGDYIRKGLPFFSDSPRAS